MTRRTAMGAAAALALTACSKPEPKRYPLKGVVISVDPKARLATIKHEKIGDWMEAMTMDFPVKQDADWQKLKPGAQITATVYVTGDNYYIGDVQVQP
jgi:Cu/Ag efflux protein CusF